jgi:predicted transposase YbfD/YdcC
MSKPAPVCFLAHFAALSDPRQVAKVLYPLPEILLIVLCGTLAGADDFVELALWGRENLQFLRRFARFVHGVPSHDTLCEVIAAIDPDAFRACFTAWVDSLRAPAPEVIAIDGKTSRRSGARSRGREPLHTVSAWATRQRLVIGQETVAAKSNEITAIPVLLQRLELQGALVTIDAMGTQREVAQTILDGGGDYVLALKANWPSTLKATQDLFDSPPAGPAGQTHQTIDNSHGRIEIRRYRVCCELGAFFARRGTRDSPAFPGVAMVGMVQSQTERDGKIERETRYYLCSTKLDAETFARVVRGHWGIENRLHWVLDVVFRDDLARLRTDHGPANMAVVRHMAVNLLSRAKPSISLKNRRKRAGWNTDYLAELIRQAA